MGGTFGLARDRFWTSLRAGRGLLKRLRDGDIDIGATECGACRIQMEQGVAKRTLHPIKLLSLAYGLNPSLRQHFKDPKPRHMSCRDRVACASRSAVRERSEPGRGNRWLALDVRRGDLAIVPARMSRQLHVLENRPHPFVIRRWPVYRNVRMSRIVVGSKPCDRGCASDRWSRCVPRRGVASRGRLEI